MKNRIYIFSKTLLLFGLSTSLFAAEEKIGCEDFSQSTTQVLPNGADCSTHLKQLNLDAFKGNADNVEKLLDELPQHYQQSFPQNHNNASVKRATIYEELIEQWFRGAKVRMDLPENFEKECWQQASEIALQMLFERKATFDSTQYSYIKALPLKALEKKKTVLYPPLYPRIFSCICHLSTYYRAGR